MAYVREANADHAVDAGQHRPSGPWRLRKILIQRVYRRAMASFSEPGRVRTVDADPHRLRQRFLDLADQGKRYLEGISTGDGLQARCQR